MLKRVATLLQMLVLALTMGGLQACSSENDSPETPVETTVSTSEMTFASTGGEQVFFVKSNTKPEVHCDQSWCNVESEASTSATVHRFKVTAISNKDTEDRTAMVMIKVGGFGAVINVTQLSADGILLSSNKINDVDDDGGDFTIALKATGSPEAISNVDRIKVVSARAMSDHEVVVNVASNLGEARSGSISITVGSVTESLTINQLARSWEGGSMESNAFQLAAKMTCGVNIGNTLEAIGAETAWGNPRVNEAYIVGLKKLGFKAVRIPCAWDGYADANGVISAKWLDRVNEVVGYCVANDMYAIVNIHWDGGWLEENCTPGKQAVNREKQRSYWTQIANRLNHYDEHLLFAGCNEPNVDNNEQMAVLADYEQVFVDAVRATGGNNSVRCLIVQGPRTNIDATASMMVLPKDVVEDRIMVEVHYYDPFQFCLMDKDADWGKMWYFWDKYGDGSDRSSTSGGADYVVSQFAKMKENFVDKGYPVVLGEYGTSRRTLSSAEQERHDQSRGYFTEVVTREARNHGIVPFLWETGGVINRADGSSKDSYVVDGLFKGVSESKYPF